MFTSKKQRYFLVDQEMIFNEWISVIWQRTSSSRTIDSTIAYLCNS